MSVKSERGFTSVQFALVFPAFLTLALFVFEVTRFFYVNIQLQDVLEQVIWQAKLGENRDLEANAKALAEAFEVQLIDPEELEVEAFSSSGVSGIADSTTAGLGGAGDVVRYEMRYAYSFFGNLGERAWEPVDLEFVEIRRNEPAFR